jgi:hypothetical protein
VKNSKFSSLRGPAVSPSSGKYEDQVDVGRGVQFAAPQLAHAHHDQPLGQALAVQGLAVDGRQFPVVELQGGGHRHLGQVRQGAGDLGQVRQAVQVPRHDAGEHPFPQLAQAPFQRFLAVDAGGEEIGHFRAGHRLRQCFRQPLGQPGPRVEAPREPAAVGGGAGQVWGGWQK